VKTAHPITHPERYFWCLDRSFTRKYLLCNQGVRRDGLPYKQEVRGSSPRPPTITINMKFNAAKEYAQGLNAQKAHGHEDWHVPTKNELNVLFNNRAAIGGFDISGSDPSGWYWSSSSFNIWLAWGRRFSDGYQDYYNKYNPSSVRCVR
jgi:hypothetical protein